MRGCRGELAEFEFRDDDYAELIFIGCGFFDFEEFGVGLEVFEEVDCGGEGGASAGLCGDAAGDLFAVEVGEVVEGGVPVDVSAVDEEAGVPGDSDGGVDVFGGGAVSAGDGPAGADLTGGCRDLLDLLVEGGELIEAGDGVDEFYGEVAEEFGEDGAGVLLEDLAVVHDEGLGEVGGVDFAATDGGGLPPVFDVGVPLGVVGFFFGDFGLEMEGSVAGSGQSGFSCASFATSSRGAVCWARAALEMSRVLKRNEAASFP